MQVKEQQLELDMEQHSGSKLGKEYIKAVYCHLAYLTFMQSVSSVAQLCLTLWPHGLQHARLPWWNAGLSESQAGIKIAGRNINNLRYADDTTLMAESEEELKSSYS